MRVQAPQVKSVVNPADASKLLGSGLTALSPSEAAAPAKSPPDRSFPPRLRTADRQQHLSPMRIDDLLEPDHPARAVWRFAEGLDLTVLYDRIRARGPTAGRSPIDPRVLVALWLYATLAGLKSANALAELVIHHDAYCWLTGGMAVNAHTLSDFRVQDADFLERMLEHSVKVLRQQGLVDLDRVAQDGHARPRQRGGCVVSPSPDARETVARGSGHSATTATAAARGSRNQGAIPAVAATAGSPAAARRRARRTHPACPPADARNGGQKGESQEEKVQQQGR